MSTAKKDEAVPSEESGRGDATKQNKTLNNFMVIFFWPEQLEGNIF